MIRRRNIRVRKGPLTEIEARRGFRGTFGQGLKWYYELSGTRGVCAVASFRLCRRPRELAIVPPESEYPVYLRIDTSDFCDYRDHLIFRTKSNDPENSWLLPNYNRRRWRPHRHSYILLALKYPVGKNYCDRTRILGLCSIEQKYSSIQKHIQAHPKEPFS